MTRLILALVVLASGAALIGWELYPILGDNADSVDVQQEPVLTTVRVLTQPIRFTSRDIEFEAMGSGRARQSVQLFPAVSEEVTAIRFQAGDKVKKGDVLVQLDDREEQLAIQLAEVKLRDAQSLLERYQMAVKDGAVPESDVDSAQAAVDMARVELDQARLDVEERKIRAPFDGVVGIPQVDPGERVTTATRITTIDDREVLNVDFEVPEILAVEMNKETRITARTPAFPERLLSGSLQALESRIDPRKRTILARARIENQDDSLRPGMSFMTRMTIPGSTYPTVPEISLQWGRDGSYIWVIREGRSVRIPVTVVARTAGDVLVEGDIRDDDPVVVEGVQRLQPERPVIVTNLSPEPDSESGDAS